MPGRIRQSDVEEVRSRTNIADVIGEHVALKSAGVGSLKGLCPFHDERSPSFHVRPQVGYYHCFGCGESGDVYTFLQRVEHLSFRESIERLAGKLGYELRYEDGAAANEDHAGRSRLLAANAAAEQFFRARLASTEAQLGRQFLGQRGFDQAAAEHFGVGFAPKSFDALGTALTAQGFTQEELLTAGLLSANDRGKVYDRFRGRLVWPIRDVTGQTVGFGARKLLPDDQDKGPKYLNTPETPIYHKSQVLYGLDLARRDISRERRVVVVEGYTDVMACHLAGITTAVATCGTSFGVEHIRVIRRVLGDRDNADVSGTGEVVFTFDPDEAGQRAASRAFAEEQRFAAQTFVAVGPEGLDPCDLRLHRGDEAVRQLVASRRPMFEFMIRRRLGGHDLETVEGRVAALREAAPVLAGIRDPSLRDGYVRSLAGWLGESPATVSRAVTSATHRRPASETAGRPAPEPATPRAASIAELPTDPITRSERDALMALLQYPDAVGAELAGRFVRARFANQTLAVVRDGIAATLDRFGGQDWVQRVLSEVPSGFATVVTQLSVAPIPERPDRVVAYAARVVSDLVERDLLRRKAELQGSLLRVGESGDPERLSELQRELVTVEQQRRALRGE